MSNNLKLSVDGEASVGKLILLLRGHIRDAFRDAQLYNFINKLCNVYTVKVYIHTWSKYANSVSWRKVNENPLSVSEKDILNYFFGLNWQIGSLIIEDDQSIPLIGDTSGNVYSTLLPKIAWKRMWYGIDRAASLIAEKEGADTMVLNTRFDVFNNSNSLNDYDALLRFIGPVGPGQDMIHYNRFLRGSTQLVGIDNFYVGTVTVMATLAHHFHTDLDELNVRYREVYYQEATVYYENRRLFLGDDCHENIEQYYYKNSADFLRLRSTEPKALTVPKALTLPNALTVPKAPAAHKAPLPQVPLVQPSAPSANPNAGRDNVVRVRPLGQVAPVGVKTSSPPSLSSDSGSINKINIKYTTTNWGNWNKKL